MKDLTRLTHDLAALNYEEGRFSGKWETMNYREKMAMEWLETAREYAAEYGIPFKENLEECFKDNEEYNDLMKWGVEYPMEAEARRLKKAVEDKIISLIKQKADRNI